jgi:hypothetical protein
MIVQIDRPKIQVSIVIATLSLALWSGNAFAFDAAASAITTQVCEIFQVAKKVLITSAVLAVLVGLAPMLWGQIKVKWIISSLVATVFFGAVPTIVSAFAVGGAACGG